MSVQTPAPAPKKKQINLDDLTETQLRQLLQQIQYKDTFERYSSYFPPETTVDATNDNQKFWARDLYPKHLEFFKAGAAHSERLFIAANRVGKSLALQYELTAHLTGHYPDWWEGRRFENPVRVWAVGKDSGTVRGILQNGLIGDVGAFGSGMIPRKYLELSTMKDAKKSATNLDIVRVKHKSGGTSTLEFKAYEQGRRAFEGRAIDIVLLDEEPPADVYHECLMRTLTTKGIMLMNFTPLLGVTQMITEFTGGDWSSGEKIAGRYVVNCTWDDVPHIDERDKKRLIAGMPKHLIDAKTKGIPVIGSGAVYPIELEPLIFIEPFEIPVHWKKVFALDFGWQDPTAILWGAIDPDAGIIYIYSEHYQSEKPPSFHAEQIRLRNKAAGFQIPGVADPSGGGMSGRDGKLVRDLYREECGINLLPAENAIEAGIFTTYELMASGKLKIFTTCKNTLSEFRVYSRNEKQKYVGKDHALDALRYLVMTGLRVAKNRNQVTQGLSDYSRPLEQTNIIWTPDSWLYR